MNTKNLYVASLEPQSGKLMVTLGVMELLTRYVSKVGFFRPVIRTGKGRDHDLNTIIRLYNLELSYDEAYAFTVEEAEAMAAAGRGKELIQGVLERYKALEGRFEFVLCEGFETSGLSAIFDFDANLQIAKNLGSPFLGVINGVDKTVQSVLDAIKFASETICEEGCVHLATIANRLHPDTLKQVAARLRENPIGEAPVYLVPEVKDLASPTMGEIKEALECSLVVGEEENLFRTVRQFKVAAMTVDNYLNYLEDGDLVITPGDRADILLGTMATFYSSTFPSISGILLSGGMTPGDNTLELIKGLRKLPVPILVSGDDTYTTAMKASKVPALIRHDNPRKIALALGTFESNVDTAELKGRIALARSAVVTPIMFEYSLFEKARSRKMHIVLPEGDEERILQAAEILLRREVVDITLLGEEQKVREKASVLGVDISRASVIDMRASGLIDRFAHQFYELRKHKGVTMEAARDMMLDENYFGTMLVYNNFVDGMVSGAVHTTADAIRPAFQVIKTAPGVSIISSIFFMCLPTRVLVYGDCAINADPNAEELAEIAISSAETAAVFGIEPLVAMLSYSTGESGKGRDVDKVRKATQIVRAKRPDLKVEGPIQYDAAIDPDVARKKLPGSDVAGKATVFIFPDLNTGNNTYKAVQRSAGAVAIGPILQGLKKPVNDLSRGCLVPDIVNTVAITAIQAQSAARDRDER